jgi:Bifunctional DNA primase/polymerase, N-terminal
LQAQRQTIEDVARRFEGKQDCNIAIITGTALGVLAFDIDGEEALKYFDEIVEKLDDKDISNAVKNTMQTETGSRHGIHIFFRNMSTRICVL